VGDYEVFQGDMMQDCGGVVKGEAKPVDGVVTAGGKLRHQIFNKITPILLESNEIKDSNVRLLIQACCLDVVTSLEDVIREYSLDDHKAAPTQKG